MEGILCSQNGCNCRDFLPFTCNLCHFQYCIDHRSRFVHDCVSVLASLINTDEENNQYQGDRESLASMMKSIENRFSSDEGSKYEAKSHNNIKQSSKNTLLSNNNNNNNNNKNIDKLMKLKDLATSRKHYNIINKTRQMLIKTKALGNPNIIIEDRIYMIIHFAFEFNHSSVSQGDKQSLYIYTSKHKTIGELLYYIWQNYAHVITELDYFKDSIDVAGLSHKDISLVMTTLDTTNWQDWDRNMILKDCLNNFEDICIHALPSELIINNQNQLLLKSTNHNTIIKENDVIHEKKVFTPSIFKKQQLAWYHKIPLELLHTLDLSNIEDIEDKQPMIIVQIIDVHQDDFPNLYYSIKINHPIQITKIDASNNLIFEQEKQTDAYHLIPLSKTYENNLNNKSFLNPTIDIALKNLQDTLSTMGIPWDIKINYSNKQYDITIGNNATISQLKLLISATLNIPVPNLQLITKGQILKNNHQKISDTKLMNKSKITVMSQKYTS